MAPIRRYLRITKYSVLEVRIYLHKPSDSAWLLSSRDNVLERIIQEVRPKVLPKLREENENAKKKGGGKKKRIKDVAAQDDFEVSIFLKETSTRHSLLTKHKKLRDKPKLSSNSNKLTGWLNGDGRDNAIRIDGDEELPSILQEEDNEIVELKDIPEATTKPITSKRKPTGDDEDEDEALFVSSSDEEFFATQRLKPTQSSKRRKRSEALPENPPTLQRENPEEQDDKKKLMLDTSYDGFSIYGRILCLIVTRKGKKDSTAADGLPAGGSQMMEQWIGTQAAQEAGLPDDEDR